MKRAAWAAAACLAAIAPSSVAETPVIAWLAAASLCQPGLGQAGADGPAPVRLEGFGTAGTLRASDDPVAQAWFEQGMATGWAFSHAEHLRAFQQAQRADPACALCAWGEAMALGPTINFGVDAPKRTQALEALGRAERLLDRDSPSLHRGLIDAARLRYTQPANEDRAAANRAYATALERLAAQHPDSDDVAVMAADALMIAYEWPAETEIAGAGEIAASSSPDLRRAERLLDTVVARSPDHTAALHFYIHLTEWMGEAANAENAADRLQALAPAAGHLVHMPSHTYGRIGRWADAARANRDAVAADRQLARRTGLAGGQAVPYHRHNAHFRAVAAVASGDRQAALAASADLLATFPLAQAGEGFGELSAASGLYAHARFGALADGARLPAVPPNRPLLQAARHYALGEAAARAGDRRELARQRQAIARLHGAMPPSPMREGAQMLSLILDGRAERLSGRPLRAAQRFDEAAAIQRAGGGVAGDPPWFWFNARRAQGQALLAAHRYRAAEAVLAQAAREWPGDGVGLAALAEARAKQGRAAEARRTWSEARAAWAGEPSALGPQAL